VNVVAISVDSPGQSREFAEKIAADGKGKVDYRILSDPGHRVIDAYGIRDPDYNGQKFEGIPRPTVYVIDRSGRVTWTKVELNYQERPTNEDIRAALNGLTTSAEVTDQDYITHHNTATKHQLLAICRPIE
jgi:peroxiredoxin